MIRAALRRLGASKLIFHRSLSPSPSPWLCSFSSIDIDRNGYGSQFASGASENALYRTATTKEPAIVDDYKCNTNLPDPIPNRPLRGSGRRGYEKRKPVVGPNTLDEKKKKQYSPQQQGHEFLDKCKLGFDKGEKHLPEAEAASTPFGTQQQEEKEEEEEEEEEEAAAAAAAEKPQYAEDIFKKMKETGLITNAVAMLDGLCKDGPVQEAMKLFGLMREKGAIPEVVIYRKGFLLMTNLLREYLDKKGPFLPLVWEAIFGKKSSQRSF